MTLRTSEASPRTADADALIIGVVEDKNGPRPAPGAQDVDSAFDGSLTAVLATLGATGKPEEITKIAATGRLPAKLIVAVGLGTSFDLETLRRAAGAAMRALTATTAKPVRDNERNRAADGPANGGQQRRIAVALPARDPGEAEAVALGALLGGYAFRRYRTKGPAVTTELTLLTAQSLAAAVHRARVLADAVALVRDLVNTGPSDLVPAMLAAEAERVAAECGIEVEILDEKGLAEGGYGGILGVGQGSANPPRLVRLEYTHPEATKTVVFAGKGITFDSGGLSLKPAKSMEWMKSDMGGAAAVLAALQAISALRPAVNVVGYLPIAENMPSGTAQRPSDVLTTYGGRTVEVLNTDAEGRLVLADAMCRAAADSPDLLIDVATLTGAQLVALGPRIGGVMANDDAVRDGIVDAARRAGEVMWPMPLPDELRKGLDSSVADLANVAPDRYGGMLVAGLFLREFVPEGVRWAHLDIAGPSFNEGEPHGYTPRGGTGAATRTLVQIVLDVADGTL